MPWFRLYAEMIDDEKIRLLAFEDRWHYVALLCCKCSGLLDAGDTPELLRRKLGVKLGLAKLELEAAALRLAEVGLIDPESFQPLGWDSRQFVSDSSAERVRRHRQKRAQAGLVQQASISKAMRAAVFSRDGNACVYCSSTDDLTIDHDIPEMRGGNGEIGNLLTACRACNASKRDMTAAEFRARNAAVTLQKRPKIQNTDTEKEEAKAIRAAAPHDAEFERWWASYPNKKGKEPARKAWIKQRLDDSADALIGHVALMAATDRGWLQGFIPMASTYINQKRWQDEPEAGANGNGRQGGGTGRRESEAERVERINRELDQADGGARW